MPARGKSGGGGKGYNPYRGPGGKFAAGPHKKRIAAARTKEANARTAISKINGQMKALKASAKGKTPKQKAAIKTKFDKLSARKEKLRGKASDAKAKKTDAISKFKAAKAEHAKGRKEAREAKNKSKPEPESKAKGTKVKSSSTSSKEDADMKEYNERVKNPFKDTPRMWGNALESMNAMRNGDHLEAAKAMGREFELNGMKVGNGTQAVKVDNSGLSAQSSAIHGRMIIADASHSWNGVTSLSSGSDAKLRQYANATSIYHGNEMYRDASHHPDRLKIQADLSENGGRGVHVLMHETLHGYSPILSSAYRHHGAAVEEITTESSARHFSSKMFGIAEPGMGLHGTGSYQNELNAAIHAVANTTGMDRYSPGAWEAVKRASILFKSRPAGSITTSDGAVHAFAKDLAHVTGQSSHHEMVDQLTQELNISATM